MSNLFEWILVADPKSRDSAKAPQLQATGTHLLLSFDRTDDSESAVSLFARWTDNLDTWTENPIGPINSGPSAAGVTVSVTENGTSRDDIIVSIPRAGTGSEGLRFLSLRASMP